MSQRKLTEVLSALNSEQIDRLSDFIRSPYFNKNASHAGLYEYLKSLHPDFPKNAISSESILRQVKGIANENELAINMTRLLDLVEKFLSMEYSHDAILERIGTLKAYKKLHLNRRFESLSKQIRKELKDRPFCDFDHWWRVHRLEEELEGFNQGLLRTPDNTLDVVFETLKTFYLTKKLRYMSEAVKRERLLGTTIETTHKEEVIRFLNGCKPDSDLYLSLYGGILKMNMERVADKAVPYYHQVKSALMAFQGFVPNDEIMSICVNLQNFCLIQINNGDQNYLHDFFEIVQFRINNNALMAEGLLNPQLFMSIVGVAIKLNEGAWAKDFIGKFRKYLPDVLREDYYHLAAGQLFYHEKRYTEACKQLAMVGHNRDDVYFGLFVKKLLLKIGYESEDIYLLAPFIATYKKHLERYRHRIGENAAILEKFYKYFRILVNSGGDKMKLEILVDRLRTEDNFADKDWLERMVENRIKNTSESRVLTQKQFSLP